MTRPFALLVLPLLFLVACAGAATEPEIPDQTPPTPLETAPAGPGYDTGQLIDDLRAAGLTVTEQAAPEAQWLTAPASSWAVNGEPVTVWAYEGESAAATEAGWIRPAGDAIRLPAPREGDGATEVLLEPAGTPHWFRRQGLIVIYTGDSQSVLAALTGALGEPFAGGPLPVAGTLPTQFRRTWQLASAEPAEVEGVPLPVLWLAAPSLDRAVAGSSGSFELRLPTDDGFMLVHGDAAAPEAATVPTVQIEPDEPLTVLVFLPRGAVTSWEAAVSTWTDEAAFPAGDRPIKSQGQRQGDFMVYELAALGTGGDFYLGVNFGFEQPGSDGQLNFYWRLLSGDQSVQPPPTPVPTATPRPTATAPAPTTPDSAPPEAILIASPGPASRLTSPIVVSGEADSTFEQNLVVRLILDDGQQLALAPTTIAADLGQRGPFRVALPFQVSGERQAFIQVYATSPRDGGVTHLSSVGVTIADSGSSSILPGRQEVEQIIILSPTSGQQVSGVIQLSGIAVAGFEQSLLVELLDEDGQVLVATPIMVGGPGLGEPGPFALAVSVPAGVSGAGRLVVRDISPAHGDNAHLASVELRFGP